MDDSEGKPSSDSVPKWQLNLPGDEPAADDAPSQAEDNNTQSDRLEVARRFLEDDAVKSAPREVKIDFLKSKGVGDEDIEFLLSEPEGEPSATEDSAPTDVSNDSNVASFTSQTLRSRRRRSLTRKHSLCWKSHLRLNHHHQPPPRPRRPFSQEAIALLW